MSKFKVDEVVFVKPLNTFGVVKGREIIPMGNNRIKIEYIVKTGDGFDNWNAYDKRDLEKEMWDEVEEDVPYQTFTTMEGFRVVMVAIVSPKDIFCEGNEYGDLPYIRKGKELRIGYAICNPNDTFDEDFGVRMALSRARKKPFCHLMSGFGGEFPLSTIMALIQDKGEYIVANIDKFVPNEELSKHQYR